jgi:undecaprenyl-diphosphatase
MPDILKLSAILRRVSRAERSTLLAVFLTALSLYVFVAIADEVREGATASFDRALMLAFRDRADPYDPLGPPWLEGLMRDFTALGSFGVLTLMTLMIVGYLCLIRKRESAWMIAVCVFGGMLMSNLLKWGFDRPRPDLVAHGTTVYTQSFPSGHAMLSATVYLTLGALLARTQADIRVKVYLLVLAGLLTIVVGISRIYLGVHWPTDVLAGWAIGAGWSLSCWLAMLWLQARGKVEPPVD